MTRTPTRAPVPAPAPADRGVCYDDVMAELMQKVQARAGTV